MADPEKSRLAQRKVTSLPIDVLVLVAGHLSARDAKAFALVNHALHYPARYRLLQRVTINAKAVDFDPVRQWLQGLESGKLLSAIHYITVLDHEYDFATQRYCGEGKAALQTQRHDYLSRVLRGMSGLKRVDWQGNHVPKSVLGCLAHMPQVRLCAHVHDHDWHFPRGVRPVETLLDHLQHNNNLHALDVEHRYTDGKDCLVLMAALKAVLLTCPSLRELRLDIGVARSGCEVFDRPQYYHGLGFKDDEKIPPLEVLEIEAYPFGVPQHTPRGLPPNTPELECWARAFDWSRLRALKLPRGDRRLFTTFFEHAPNLSALRDLDCGLSDLCDITSRPEGRLPLQLSSITSVLGLEEEGWVYTMCAYGATLTRLSARINHHMINIGARLPRNVLEDVRDGCPALRELEIDIWWERHSWPYKTLGVLASFPNLRMLTLWFPIHAHRRPRFAPSMTFAAATMFFRYLRERGSGVRELVIHWGEPLQPQDRELLEDIGPYDDCTTFRCELPERDWDVALGRFTTTCVDVNERANEWMRAQEGQSSSMSGSAQLSFEEVEEEMAVLGLGALRSFHLAWLGVVASEGNDDGP